MSLGIYLPFSIIPVDIETSHDPLDSFKNNEFRIEVDSDGYKTWQTIVRFKGEKEFSLRPMLKR